MQSTMVVAWSPCVGHEVRRHCRVELLRQLDRCSRALGAALGRCLGGSPVGRGWLSVGCTKTGVTFYVSGKHKAPVCEQIRG